MPLIAARTGIFETSRSQTIQLNPTKWKRLAAGASLFLVLVIFPSIASEYQLSIASLIGVFAISAVGLNLLTGVAGQISIGQAAFMAVGAYTAARLNQVFGFPYLPGLIVAGLAAALVSAVFGLAALRVKGLYLAVATLAAQVLIDFMIVRFSFISGGVQAVTFISPAELGPLVLSSSVAKYLLTMVVLLLGVIVAENLMRTRHGRAWTAIGDHELAAKGMGISVFRAKLQVFMVAAFYAGVSGAIYAHNTGLASPEFFTLRESIALLVMVVIGGLGKIPGALMGAAFIQLLPIVLREIASSGSIPFITTGNISFLQEVLFGVVLVLFLIIEGDGLYRLFTNVRDYFRQWPFSY